MKKLLTTVTALVAGTVLALGFATPASATPDTVEVVWLLPETVTELPTGNTPAIWPQTHLADGIVPCGRFAQADVYTVEDAALLTADGVLTEGEDYKVVISWRFIAGPACEVIPECPAYDFPKDKMWEVTWGYGFADRNGGAPIFDMTSNGGLVGVNGKPVPAYMTVGWHWLYVTGDRVVTYQFADGTERTATVTGTDCTPSIVWALTPPPVVVPPTTPPVTPPAPSTLASTGADTLLPLGIAGVLLLVGGLLFSLSRIRVAGAGD